MSHAKVVLTAMLALSTAACATRASSVAPISVSAAEYSYLGCQDARAELATAQQKEFSLTRKQNNAATEDAAAVFLFALPLGSVFGQDVSGELAQAKGERLALQHRVEIACTAEASAERSPSVQPAVVPASVPAQTQAQAAPAASTRKSCAVRSLTSPDAVSC